MTSEVNQTFFDSCACTEIIEKIDLFVDKINEVYSKCCPIRSTTITDKYIKSPWITPAIQNSICTKSNYIKLNKQGIISRETNDYYKNQVNKIIRAAKREYYSEFICTYGQNIKKTWAAIRTMIGNIKAANCIPTFLKLNRKTIEDKNEMGNDINIFL